MGSGVLLGRYAINIAKKLIDRLFTLDFDKMPKHDLVKIIEKINEYKNIEKDENKKQMCDKILQRIKNRVDNDDYFGPQFKDYINSKIYNKK